MEKLKSEGREPPLPDIPGGGYLLRYLWEVGPVEHTAMGAAPLSHRELRAWQDNIGIELHPWESRLLHSLSQAYLAAYQAADSPSCPPPWQPEAPPEDDRATVARKLQLALRGHMESRKRTR